MPNIDHIIIDETDDPIGAVKEAFFQAVGAAALTEASEILVIVSTKGDLAGSVIEGALGKANLRKLLMGQSISLPTNIKVRLATKQTFNSARCPQVVLSYYLTVGDLEPLLAKTHKVEVVVFLPWIQEHIQTWVRLKSAKRIPVRREFRTKGG